MNRLTKKYSGTHVCYKNEYGNTVLCGEMTVPQIKECMDKLKAYEDVGLEPEEVYKTIKSGVPEWIPKYLEYRDLEKQGRLIKLPCKVWDTLYIISSRVDGKGHVRRLTLTHNNMGNILSRLGNDVFLTREEAERALKGMEK